MYQLEHDCWSRLSTYVCACVSPLVHTTHPASQDKLKFMTYVVAAGVMYGDGESMWHSFFKSAWHSEQPGLKVFGDGQNVVPTIHVKDLTRLVMESHTDVEDIQLPVCCLLVFVPCSMHLHDAVYW